MGCEFEAGSLSGTGYGISSYVFAFFKSLDRFSSLIHRNRQKSLVLTPQHLKRAM